jgi:hypothetical protein
MHVRSPIAISRAAKRSPSTRRPIIAALAGLAALFPTTLLEAQTLRRQATPFSVWIDLREIAAAKMTRGAALPIWLDSVQFEAASASPGDAAHAPSVYRLHFRRMAQLNTELHLRLFFDDLPGRAPSITAWSETGVQRFASGALGNGLEMPVSESLLIPMADVDDIEITVPGDGRTVRGVFLSTMQKTEMHRALDFAVEEQRTDDPFNNLPAQRPPDDDLFLYGRVRATLEPGVLKLLPKQPPTFLEFTLDRRPLLAIVTFEALEIDPALPPEIIVNKRRLGAVSVHAPDLADPGYVGTNRPLDPEMHFRYAGWLRCQKIIPASALDAGLNQLTFQLPRQSGAMAIRAIELQLKHNWHSLEYKIVP